MPLNHTGPDKAGPSSDLADTRQPGQTGLDRTAETDPAGIDSGSCIDGHSLVMFQPDQDAGPSLVGISGTLADNALDDKMGAMRATRRAHSACSFRRSPL
jgi:hypothetical protein